MILRNLDARLAKLEGAADQGQPRPCWRIIANSEAERDAKIRELIEAGHAAENDSFIVRLIVDAPARNPT